MRPHLLIIAPYHPAPPALRRGFADKPYVFGSVPSELEWCLLGPVALSEAPDDWLS